MLPVFGTTQVHQGVELRVKAAMARADELEAQLELARAQHTQHTQQLQLQQANLEAALQEAQQQAAEQRQQLMAAQASGATMFCGWVLPTGSQDCCHSQLLGSSSLVYALCI